VWPIFAALARTLSRGHPTAPRVESPSSFEAEWAGPLANLKLPPHALRDVVAAGTLAPHFHYRRFHKRKSDGGRREIAEPDPRLKRLQHAIITRYFTHERPHPAAIAYQKGKSTPDHIWAHAGAEVVVLADVRDFFPSTCAHRVEAWWRGRVEADAAQLLALLTTDRGGLPQGAPTSPGLSNFVNHELDTLLAQRAGFAGARYTRYCDDLAFSWPTESGPPSGFEAGVRSALSEFGYELNGTKGWCVFDRCDEPEVTGAILTRAGGVRLPDRLRRVMRELARSGNPRDAQRLRGYEGYAAMISRPPKRQEPKRTELPAETAREEATPRAETADAGEGDPIPF
jgi:hypothetical protein